MFDVKAKVCSFCGTGFIGDWVAHDGASICSSSCFVKYLARAEYIESISPPTFAGDVAQAGAAIRAEFADIMERELQDIEHMLVEKNRAYGNSALDPVRVFSKASVVEQLLVRMDDKLSRIVRGHAAGEDAERDLVGYLFILRIARKMLPPPAPPADPPDCPSSPPCGVAGFHQADECSPTARDDSLAALAQPEAWGLDAGPARCA